MGTVIPMASTEGLVGKLLYEFPELSSHIAHDLVICGAQELSKKHLFQHTIDLSGELQRGVQDYDFEHLLPDDLRVASIDSVDYCGCCIYPTDPKCNPCPDGYELCNMHTLRLWPCPQTEGPNQTLTVCLYLEPTHDACDIPEILITHHWKYLRDFVRSELAMMPNKPWTNPRYGELMMRKAASQKNSAACRSNQRNTRGVKRAQGTPWL